MSDFNGNIFLDPISGALYRQKHESARKRVEVFDLGNGITQRFLVDDDGVIRDTEKKPDRQRCKYCGCLVSSFDAHCNSCGAPI